jgi:hypothetical protein
VSSPPSPDACYLGDAPAAARCVRCDRPLCELHAARGSGLAVNVFGALFDDHRPRCTDCYAARFWQGGLAMIVAIGAVIAIVSAIEARPIGIVAGVIIAIGGGACCAWQARVHGARAGGAGRRAT